MLSGVVLLSLAGGCYGLDPFLCGVDADCSSSEEGVCLEQGCAYPTDDCPSGLRFSDLAIASSADACVEPGGATTVVSGTETQGEETGGSETSGTPGDCSAVDCGMGECVVADGAPVCSCGTGQYAVPGPTCTDDPCAFTRCFFVDADADEGGDGSSQAPWRSLAEARDGLATQLQPGDHVLLRRGARWSESLRLSGLVGTDAAPIVVGAYGDDAAGAPSVAQVWVEESTYVTVRDLEVDGTGFEGRSGIRAEFVDHLIVRDSHVHDVRGEGIGMHYGAEHTVVVGNRIERVTPEENSVDPNLLVVADDWWNSNTTDVGDHHYIVDNVLIGQAPASDTSTDRGIVLSNRDGVGDFKVFGNRLTGVQRQGLWFQGSGYAWIMNNDIGDVSDAAEAPPEGGNWHAAVIVSHESRVRMLGNRVFSAGNPIILGAGGGASDVEVRNNTLAGGGDGWTVWLGQARGVFEDNLLIPDAEAASLMSSDYSLHEGLELRDNAFAASACVMGLFGEAPLDFAQWQAMGFDDGSACAPVPGVSSPVDVPADPQTWPTFDALTPGAQWGRCDRPAGARDCTGEPTASVVEAWPQMPDNGGRGWEGPPIVLQRYPIE